MLHARKDYNERIQDNANRISADEPVFLFRAQDKFMLPILKKYLSLLGDEPDTPLVIAILKHMARTVEWQAVNPIKEPDTPMIEIL